MLKKLFVLTLLFLGLQLQASEKKAPVVVFETNLGKIELKLYPRSAKSCREFYDPCKKRLL